MSAARAVDVAVEIGAPLGVENISPLLHRQTPSCSIRDIQVQAQLIRQENPGICKGFRGTLLGPLHITQHSVHHDLCMQLA